MKMNPKQSENTLIFHAKKEKCSIAFNQVWNQVLTMFLSSVGFIIVGICRLLLTKL